VNDREPSRQSTIAVKVVPRAATEAVVGWLDDGSLKVRVTAPPEGGRANAAVEALLAAALGLKKSAVRIVGGHGATHKRVEVDGLPRAEIERRLGVLFKADAHRPAR
jgi:uncharacterized protein YggU (UPF0235/DUF167 family)